MATQRVHRFNRVRYHSDPNWASENDLGIDTFPAYQIGKIDRHSLNSISEGGEYHQNATFRGLNRYDGPNYHHYILNKRQTSDHQT